MHAAIAEGPSDRGDGLIAERVKLVEEQLDVGRHVVRDENERWIRIGCERSDPTAAPAGRS